MMGQVNEGRAGERPPPNSPRMNATIGGGAIFIVFIIVAIWLASGFYIVDEGKRGVVLRPAALGDLGCANELVDGALVVARGAEVARDRTDRVARDGDAWHSHRTRDLEGDHPY